MARRGSSPLRVWFLTLVILVVLGILAAMATTTDDVWRILAEHMVGAASDNVGALA